MRQWSNAICTFIRLNGKVYESGLSDGISEEKKAAIVDSFKMVGIENRDPQHYPSFQIHAAKLQHTHWSIELPPVLLKILPHILHRPSESQQNGQMP